MTECARSGTDTTAAVGDGAQPSTMASKAAFVTSSSLDGALTESSQKGTNVNYDGTNKTTSDEIINSVSSANPQQTLPSLTTADVMDCFRLYFGSNVVIFPFYAARLGAVGIVVMVCCAIGVCLMTQTTLHRTRYNLMVLEVRRRVRLLSRMGEVGEEKVGAQRHDQQMAEIVVKPQHGSSSSVLVVEGHSVVNDVATKATPAPSAFIAHGGVVITSAEAALERMRNTRSADIELGEHSSSATTEATTPTTRNKGNATDGAADPSDLLPYYLHDLATLVKVCTALWQKHWINSLITVATCFVQFFGSCGVVLLLARNLGHAVGLGDDYAVYVSAVAMAVLTMDTSHTTKTILAYCNNLFILGGSAFILVATMLHEQTEAEQLMSLQLLPKSFTDFIIYAPSVIAYVAPQLVTIDAETVVSERANRLHFAKIAPQSQHPQQINTIDGSAFHPHMPIGSTSISPTTPSVSTASSNSLFAGLSSSSSSTFKRRMQYTFGTSVALQRCFRRALFVGAGVSVFVLLFVAEFIVRVFKDNTESVLALSFPPSLLRTGILGCLSIGIYACGALNVSPICDVLDTLTQSLSLTRGWAMLLQKAFSRGALFTLVVAFLYLVPFFDLVAALSSAVATPLIAFFIPAMCEIQSEMLKVYDAEVEEADRVERFVSASVIVAPSNNTSNDTCGKGTAMNLPPPPPGQSQLSLAKGWAAMPTFSKALAAFSFVVGSLILTCSTCMVIVETMRRKSE